mmetsp:Transcript_150127/g.482528  ORF Transcript_150127/g.482528 Transcript_150127/m.482528 type:complete len:377 (-) Transcript_150127:52-1182(-)
MLDLSAAVVDPSLLDTSVVLDASWVLSPSPLDESGIWLDQAAAVADPSLLDTSAVLDASGTSSPSRPRAAVQSPGGAAARSTTAAVSGTAARRAPGQSQQGMQSTGGNSRQGGKLSESHSSPSILGAGTSCSGTFLTTLSKHRSLPRISFGVRTSANQADENPGPGSYNTHEFGPERISRMRQTPAYNFGALSERKGMADTRDLPGPGAYGVPKDVGKYATERKSGFGGAPRGAVVRCFHVTAGPGQYALKSTLSDSPAFTATGKRYRRSVKSLLRPGPGSYEPSVSRTSQFAAAPQVGFGTMSRPEMFSKHLAANPGPGTYPTKSYMGTAEFGKFSIVSRRRTHDLQPYVQPGPGQYDSHAGSFGYPVGIPAVPP